MVILFRQVMVLFYDTVDYSAGSFRFQLGPEGESGQDGEHAVLATDETASAAQSELRT